MRTKPMFAMVVVAVLAAVTGCQDHQAEQRQALHAQVSQADAQIQAAARAVAQRESSVAALDAELQSVRLQRAELNAGIKAYMLDHKLAVAAIVAGAAGGLTLISDDSNISPEAREIAGMVGLLALTYALFNAEEVAQVAGELALADANLKRLALRERQTATALDAEQSALASERMAWQALQQRLGQLRTELAAV